MSAKKHTCINHHYHRTTFPRRQIWPTKPSTGRFDYHQPTLILSLRTPWAASLSQFAFSTYLSIVYWMKIVSYVDFPLFLSIRFFFFFEKNTLSFLWRHKFFGVGKGHTHTRSIGGNILFSTVSLPDHVLIDYPLVRSTLLGMWLADRSSFSFLRCHLSFLGELYITLSSWPWAFLSCAYDCQPPARLERFG